MLPTKGNEDESVRRQRRAYFRDKQRLHRQREKDELMRLRAEYAVLARELQAFQLPPRSADISASMSGHDDHFRLSWQEIAHVFRTELDRAGSERAHLRNKTIVTLECIHALHRVVLAARRRPTATSLSPHWCDPTHAVLPSRPDARATAKDWFMRQMYHNTDRVFHGFPSTKGPTDSVNVIDVQYAGPTYLHSIEQSQTTFGVSLEAVVDVLRQRLHTFWPLPLPVHLTVETTDNTNFYRVPLPFEGHTCLLHGWFSERDRCVMVFRRVQEDDADPRHPVNEKHSMEWIDIRRVSATQTTMRVFSSTVTSVASLDQLARANGLDLSHQHPQTRTKLQQLLVARGYQSSEEFHALLNHVLQKTNDVASCTVV
ncbi:Aste57867_3041 [Aphanomyces stellatus]|uniref:Aste57867_3041 protein n=1 Tax=Aphanomyces stellatus TaxID=120398 RepID=A0A485KD69_9STRA|nr:hypothetical protein As57867_003032 [Aphanomyces stellatus]VFT80221.1 Aste57867_3041 [Aphanomyces stellatus]